MPTTPQITLTAMLSDITGQPAGTSDAPAHLLIELCGYGLTLPQIPTTETLTKISMDIADDGSGISVQLWGNDVITPVGETYYAITVIDADGNIVQTAAYQFTGTETVDLSSATPYNPPPYPPYIPPIQYLECSPQPPQSMGVVYTAPSAIAVVYYNGFPQRKGIDWFPVGSSATMFTLNFPTFSGETVYAICIL